ncbi:MAG: sorbosone dehydrogenase family protein [Solirubrobacterales bacterium]
MGTLIVAVSLLAAAAATSAQAASLQSVGNFSEPTFVTSDPGNPNRLFVVQRKGRIMQVENGTVSEFANIESQVSSPIAGEQGLLSIALAPDFASSGRVFAFFTGRELPWPEIHIAELRASGSTASFARDLLKIPHPKQGNHYGGQIAFGPEGLLFVGTGDGGGSDDEMHNAQDRTSLLGKILRIDVGSTVLPYAVPPSNPFAAGLNPNERLVFAYGLRNPFRFSFDRLFGDLVIGDVGQSAREEVDWAPAAANLGIGRNYGWNCREGKLPGPATDPGCTPGASFIEPAFDYPHVDPGGGAAHGSAIIGGYVVRDPSLPELAGRYLYGDLSGEIRSLVLSEASTSDRAENLVGVSNLNSFGEDSCGRVYAVSGNGPVYRVTGPTPNTCTPPPPPAVAPPLTPSVVGIRAVTRRVKRNGRAQLTVWVTPCAGRRGEPVKLLRGRARLGSRRLDRACTARFLPRVRHRMKFRAEIGADETYLAGSSRQLGVRVYRPKKGKRKQRGSGRVHVPAGVGRR